MDDGDGVMLWSPLKSQNTCEVTTVSCYHGTSVKETT